MLRKWGTLALLLLITPMLALAQNTGKLAGRILDGETGEPLPGASVVIVGTQRGAVTNVDGEYFVIGVPVGIYDVTASFVGYQSETVSNVEINAGYTREINFTLSPGTTLEEVVVEYERPLIQKDALGAPRVVTGEEIQNLPVRGVATVAALQSGVVNNEGSGTLNIRGGRGEEVTFYVDGVKVVGNLGVAQGSVAEQEMLIGGLPAKYGDAMGGVISVTTKSGTPKFFGSLEGITSQALDAFEYNLASATLGGPIIKEKAGFFLSVEYQDVLDSDPRAVKTPQISESLLNRLIGQPQVLEIEDANGNRSTIPFSPVGAANGATVGLPVSALGIPEGSSVVSFNPASATQFLNADDFTFEEAKPNNDSKALDISGNITVNPFKQVRLRIGGQYADRDFNSYSIIRSIFNPFNGGKNEQNTTRAFVNWTHYLSGNTFYQLQADWSNFKFFSYHNAFSNNVEDALFYGDIDNAANAAAARYALLAGTSDFDHDGAIDSVFYTNRFEDGTLPGLGAVFSQYADIGSAGVGYSKGRTEQIRFSANATTQLGIHQIEFGGEYEQRTQRSYGVNGTPLARFFDDGNVEGDAEKAVSNWNQLQFSVLDDFAGYFGYNYLGTEEVDDENLNSFVTGDENQAGSNAFNVAPRQPIYYAGYLSDKIEFRDIVLQVGVRLDLYDSNQRVLRDPFALVPIKRAEDLGATSSIIGRDFAVYCANGDCSSNNNIVGFRDLDGIFYDKNGQVVSPSDVTTAGSVVVADGFSANQISEAAFKDFEPKVNVQPRIGVTFPVTDQALFFAHYDVLSQRPTVNQFATLLNYRDRLQGSGGLGNPNLEPQETIEYELGFRQRLGSNAAIQISGFYRQIQNLIQQRALKNVFPNNYTTWQNVDFGTVKGAEFEFDLRRTNNVSMNVNYTLSFAQGTGSDASTTGNIFWLREASPFVPNFISPLDFDRRHTANITLDYRLGKGEGPMVFGATIFENFGVNVIGSFKSGQPYSALVAPYARHSPVRLTGLKGQINGNNLPASSLINLRVDRAFQLTDKATVTAYVWVQNLLDEDNVIDVYQFTGAPDEDGYLDSALGLAEFPIGSIGREYYKFRLKSPFNYGIPRQTRVGLRLNF